MAGIGIARPLPPSATAIPSSDQSGHRGLVALLFPEESWLVFALMAVLFLITVWTVEGSKWVRDMPGLTGEALGALLTGYVLARIKIPAVLLHPVGLVIGFLVVCWQTINAASGGTTEDRIVDAAVRLYNFDQVVRSGTINTDSLPFVIQIILLTWFVGYFSAWFLYRSHNVWLAVLPAGVSLMVNLTYVPGRFVANFVIFLIAALLLVMTMHGVEQHRRWRRSNVPPEEVVHLSYVGPVLVFGGVLLVVSFWLPLLEQSTPVTAVWQRLTGPWRSVEQEFDRLFSTVSSGKVSPLHSFGRAMPFRGAVTFGDQLPLAGQLGFARDIVAYVQVDEAGYWRAESYDTYTSQGWISTDQLSKSFPQDSVPGAVEEFKARRLFNQTVEAVAPTDVLLARGLPTYGSIPAKGEIGQPATFTVSLTDLSRNRGLSQELRDLATDLSRSLQSTGGLVSPGTLQRLLPPDLRAKNPSLRGTRIESVDLARTEPFPLDFSSVRTVGTLAKGQKYTITSAVSTASVEDLQGAGTRYVGWVRDRYLQIPGSLPQRVKNLAEEWTKDAKTPFDKAVAIESKLRQFEYATNVSPPPRDGDGVDHFLFTLKRGYADYNASAMAVMLRALGIPSRVSVGYVAGDWDNDLQRFTVREAHAHAWPEVFFPGFGWIEFSPTPNWPSIGRLSGSAATVNPEDDSTSTDALPLEDEALPEDAILGTEVPQDQVDVAGLFQSLFKVVGGLAVVALVLRLVWLAGLSRLSLPAQTYEKMCRLAGMAKLAPRKEQTPSEYAQVLAAALPSAHGNIQAIVRGYSRTVYGQWQPSAQESKGLREAWDALRWRLLLKALRWRDKRSQTRS